MLNAVTNGSYFAVRASLELANNAARGYQRELLQMVSFIGADHHWPTDFFRPRGGMAEQLVAR